MHPCADNELQRLAESIPERSAESSDLSKQNFSSDCSGLIQSLRQRYQNFSRTHPELTAWSAALTKALLIYQACSNIVPDFSVVRGQSMEPNVHNGDKIVGSQFTEIERFDLITFIPPSETDVYYIKRVIAFPGESVELKQDQLFINGEEVEQPQHFSQTDNFGPVIVPTGSLFVLGDNRPRSSDSREFGMVVVDHADVREVIMQYTPIADVFLLNLIPEKIVPDFDVEQVVDKLLTLIQPHREEYLEARER